MRSLFAASVPLLAFALWSPRASAQVPPLADSIAVGSWTFRPSLEVRVRGEVRRHPVDAGGKTWLSPAVLHDGATAPLEASPTVSPALYDQAFVAERVRLGLAVDRGPVTGAFVLQDARTFGMPTAGGNFSYLPAFVGMTDLPSGLLPYEAYVDVHTQSDRKVFFRLGRQRVQWGDGRLVGTDDWSSTGRSLDAARFGFQAGDFDVEAMAAMLAAPGLVAPTTTTTAAAMSSTAPAVAQVGIGAELYGLDAVWHAIPLFNIEATGLARVARDPLPASLTPSNIIVADARVFGERRGVSYAAEGAFEAGNVASYGAIRGQRAFAVAARAAWETAAPGHLTFGVEGAYASGDDGSGTGTQTRFDPILPDTHTTLGPMGLFAWSNVIEAGGTFGARPLDWFALEAGYRYAAFANPNGRWITAALAPVGQATSGTTYPDLNQASRSLGHEVDAKVKLTPWHIFGVEAGYGVFIFGDRAVEILREADRPARLSHWGYLQAIVRAP